MRYLSVIFLLSLVISCSTTESSTYERFYFRTDGADLAIEVNGNFNDNTFILLLHGGPGAGALGYNYGDYADLLEEQYAMVYMDQRGQGASKGKYDKSQVRLQAFSDDIYNACVMLRAKYGSDINIFLMGHSWGGLTGTHALLNTNVENEIQGWIEADGAHDIPLLNKEMITMIDSIGTVEINAGNNVDKWQEMIDYVSSLDPDNVSIEEGGQLNSYGFEAEGLIDAIAEGGSGTYPYGLATDPDFSLAVLLTSNATASLIEAETEASALTSQLSQISSPTLLLWGAYDFVVPPALGQSADSLIPNSELVLFSQSGHSPMDSEPQAYAQAVIDFVETNRVYPPDE